MQGLAHGICTLMDFDECVGFNGSRTEQARSRLSKKILVVL